MRNAYFILAIIIQLFFGQKIFGQRINVGMDSLSHDSLQWCYIGNGEFMSMRSCYATWMQCTFYSVYYKKETKTLFVKGRVYNSNGRLEGPIKFAQVVIGNFSSDSSDVLAPTISVKGKDSSVVLNSGGFDVTGKHFTIRSNIQADVNGKFKGKFHLEKVTDELCIIPCENNGSFEITTSKFYSIGKLLKLE